EDVGDGEDCIACLGNRKVIWVKGLIIANIPLSHVPLAKVHRSRRARVRSDQQRGVITRPGGGDNQEIGAADRIKQELRLSDSPARRLCHAEPNWSNPFRIAQSPSLYSVVTGNSRQLEKEIS